MKINLIYISLILLIGLSAISEAVDKSKFKTCNDLSFCRRQRSFEKSHLDYQLDVNTFAIKDSKFMGVINEHKTKTQYPFELTRLNESIIHLRVNERKPLFPRHIVSDVILEDGAVEVPFKGFDSKKNVLTVDDSYRIEINPESMSFDFYYNDEKALTINQRGLFNFEYLRTREDSLHLEKTSKDGDELTNENQTSPISMEGAFEERWGSFKDTKKRGPESVGLDFRFYSKSIFGIPEHAIDFDLPPSKGKDIKSEPYRLYNLDVFEFELDSKMALYGSVPLLYGHDEKKTVGLLWLNAAETWVDIDKDNKEHIDAHIFSEAGIIDVYIMINSEPRDVIKDYGKLTGTQVLPPMFSIAYHQCRWNYESEEDVANINQGFEEHNIPYDVLWLDIEHTDKKKYFTWDSRLFPTPRNMIDKIASYGRKMVTIIDPHIKRDNDYEIHKEAENKDLYVKDNKGDIFKGWCWPGESSYLDFFNPKVRSWWASLYKYDRYKGSTPSLYTWNDMNEPSVFNGPEITMPKDCVHYEGTEHRQIHNMYGLYMHMSTYQGQLERNSDKNIRPFVLSRSFFSGTQRYGAVWTGDNEADWDHLMNSVPMILSLGMGGIPFSGADVGGFFRNPNDELMTRWYQLGAWYPFFRAHGHIDTKRKEPWVFGEPFTTVIRESIRDRYIHLPYYYTQFYRANTDLYPIMRPMLFEFSKDVNTFSMDDQFMVGPSILVKPIGQPGQSFAEVYFPKNTIWYEWKTLRRFEGLGKKERVSTPLEYYPVFYRGGSILPLKETIRRSSAQMVDDPYTLIVVLDENEYATGDLYSDDGETFDYDSGYFIYKNFTFNKGDKAYTLTSTTADERESKAYRDLVKNILNKVVIAGVKNAPKEITLTQGENTTELTFEYDEKAQIVTVRKPGAKISEPWNINITY